jgi:hypothetical protein
MAMDTPFTHHRPGWPLALGALAVLIVVCLSGVFTPASAPLISGASAKCEGTAQAMMTFAHTEQRWSKTSVGQRTTYWSLRSLLLRECSLSAVAYFSTHDLKSFLDH